MSALKTVGQTWEKAQREEWNRQHSSSCKFCVWIGGCERSLSWTWTPSSWGCVAIFHAHVLRIALRCGLQERRILRAYCNMQQSQKRCESNKTALYLCVCRRKKIVSIREGETQNLCFFYHLWADPDLRQEYLVLLKNILSLPVSQKTKQSQKKEKNLWKMRTRPLVFLSFSQQDMLDWNLFPVPRQNYILRVWPEAVIK